VSDTKPFRISKNVVMEAYKRVKANRGVAGIDEETIEEFEKDLQNNLYKIWNRMSSGTYFPPAVKQVTIPKNSGGTRKLGIPAVSDRVAQTVAKCYLEPKLEPIFHDNSFGYRPERSQIQALTQTRAMCFKYAWAVEFDIKGLFDNIDRDLLMKAVRKHTSEKWIILYIERWLKAPFQTADGEIIVRNTGTSQGSVISPLLSNLFMHYVFDLWMSRTFPSLAFERFADDGIIHCLTQRQAEYVMAALGKRLKECKLEIHPEKSKVIYCKGGRQKSDYQDTKFTFLGYEFRPRLSMARSGKIFVGFSPAASKEAKKKLMDKIRKMKLQIRTDSSLEDLRSILNPIMRGWINYFGAYNRSSLRSTVRNVNLIIVTWAMRKFKRFGKSRKKARRWLKGIYKRNPQLFAHWCLGLSM